ncbi:MAG: hypothetical protein U9M95_02125 [Candidatus Altiarchaeota archaeon]|nr:hypothetical protein [Candidatus Altiarchaeota archaeon]
MEQRLTKKDKKRLNFVFKSIARNDACTYDKQKCLQHLESIINPRCVVCREPLDSNFEIVNDKKMHKKCRKRYNG